MGYSEKKSNVLVARCKSCKPYPFQDKKYGVGRRVFTTGATQHCTVCGKRKE